MGRSQKPKRITWASDGNLCQVRLFLSEDYPSQVGIGSQEHLQAKSLWQAQSGSGSTSNDNLPPGFEGIQPPNPWTAKLSQIPLIKWKCPPRLVVNAGWRVVAGDESNEMETQNEREMRVLEAIYPRSTAIPPNPSPLIGEENSTNDDRYTPVVPVTPIEDEDAAALDASVNITNSVVPQTQNLSQVSSDVMMTSALTSAISNSNQGGGNMIDRDLLLKILCDPKMVQHLVTNHTAVQNAPPSPSVHSNIPCTSSSSTQYNNSFAPPPLRPPANGPFYPPSRVGPIPPNQRPPSGISDLISAAPSPPPAAKDISYYKSLIQQHGGERRENMQQFGQQIQNNQEASNMMKQRDSKPKVMKPCMYFNSPRGCRNGANCTYLHEMTSSSASTQQRVSSMPEVQSSKRVKLDREITGT
ncbi:hypothetical protein ABFS82_03G068300 [Erythranthe guttata]|uniref:zinc finger CCCH domain-containing protein 6 n=1 Tax=Erythranthe guttata TaxID=4155 RepID=UPI00064DA596|nr:PREDICTED: zinc finger CCCH domain-containing protein 6 [Erythranthe guttata]|eukprot:XP_012835740.1 PREDICTED: zinc finger CCCH domain-containing protein 6 [Erythranthe guttata]